MRFEVGDFDVLQLILFNDFNVNYHCVWALPGLYYIVRVNNTHPEMNEYVQGLPKSLFVFLNGTPKLITTTVLKLEKWGLNAEMRFNDAVGMAKV